ncbi:MAG TPA: DegQ family serine endoprotease [Burkholderiales bacterium]|nr:DegQ family serine endoprotease [Burkholderiales bacterium]
MRSAFAAVALASTLLVVPGAPPAQAQSAPQALPQFSAIVEANKSAVVNITSRQSMQPAAARPDIEQFRGTPFYDFFRRFGEGAPNMPPRQGQGSGFIVQSDGIVLTNAHVVEGAEEVRVRLPDRREFEGKVLGVDKPTDIAVVKIDAKDLPTVKLGDPKDVKVGEWVLAIGSPFGFENSVTAGIVSATSRSLPEGTYVPFIQTDAAVNPGNSGGPLFNMKGEVIGINSQIYSRTGGYMGLSFAIPINVAADVQQQLVKHGKVARGRIGVSIQEVSQSLAQSFGLDRPYGALVSSVEPGGPADKAGLKAGDVLLSVNGKTIERSAEAPPLIAAVKPGTRATLEVWREGKKRAIEVTVGELKAEQIAAGPAGEVDGGKLGLAVRPLTDGEAKQLDGAQGLFVENASGPAARAGIRRGDVVTSVNGKPVNSPAELKSAVEHAKGPVALLIKRGEASLFVPVDIG